MTIEMFVFSIGMIILIILALIKSIRIVTQDSRGIVERLGQYNRIAEPGLQILIPFVERMVLVNITEQIDNCESMEVITKDNLNAHIAVQIYYKVLADEASLKKSQYAVNDYQQQIISLTSTTTRNVIGTMSFKEANSERSKINKALETELKKHVDEWGIALVRTEIKQIAPPTNVQEAMNDVIVAEQTKTAATDFATATELKADGEKRASIKQAEGEAKAITLKAEAEAKAIEVINKTLKNAKSYPEWLKANKWDGHLPQVTGGAIPMLNLGEPKNKGAQ